MLSMKNYYELLNIEQTSSTDEIKEAYSQAKHLYGNSDALYSLYSPEEKSELLKHLNHAYETLMDQKKRKEYDESLKMKETFTEETKEINVSSLLGSNENARNSMLRVSARASFKKKPPVLNVSAPIIAEQYRVLFTRLEQKCPDSNVFAITSSIKNEGKSITALNLAYIIATEFKKRTVIVECDLRKPSTLEDYIDMPRNDVFVDILSGKGRLESALTKLVDADLYVLTSGKASKSSSELLSSARFGATLKTLKQEFDYVIVDCPPVLPIVDMSLISKHVDGIILVVKSGKTQTNIVDKAVNSLNGCNLVGVVLNCSKSKLQKYYY